MKRGPFFAVLALLAMLCGSAQPMSGPASGGELQRNVPAVLVPVDGNGNVQGSAEPWTFSFDFDDNNKIRPSSAGVTSTAQKIAAYMKKNPAMTIRQVERKSAGADKLSARVQQRRDAAIRDALVNAGVPANKISLGITPSASPASR